MLAGVSLSGCESVSFYTQAVQGQAEILLKREAIGNIIAQTDTEPELVDKLRYLQAARQFASDHLGLPDNASYTRYADLKRRYVVWNVVATERYSVQPKQQCFPIAGCVTYRGYFSREDADGYAGKLRQTGLDVVVGGVSAYSTLGWFADPILNTMLARPREDLAGLLFHELAHQQFYLKGDTTFNESFATTVEREGLKAWLDYRGEQAILTARLQRREKRDAVVALILEYRQRLGARYATLEDVGLLEAAKQEGFAQMRQAYAGLKKAGVGTPGFDHWMAGDLNNASLALFADYNTRVPEFTALLEKEGHDWGQFYRAVEALGQ